MKRLMTVLAVAAVLGTAAGVLQAEQGQDAPKQRKRPQRKPRQKRPLLRGMHAQMIKVCDLSEDQQKRIAELAAERSKALKDFNTENAEKIKALSDEQKKAREAKDKEALKKARDEYSALRAKQNEITKKSQDDIMAVLTPEQKAKWDEYQAVLTVKRRFRGIELTEDQVAKIKAAYVKTAAGADMTTEKGRRGAYAKLYAEVQKEVLTEEQRTTVAVGYITGRYRRLKLTEDQVAQIKAAYVKATTGVNMDDRKAAAEAMNKLTEQIRTDILTDAQREQVKAKARPGQRTRKPKPEKPAQ